METFIIDGVGEFTCQKLNAMAGAKIINRIQKIALPVLAGLTSGGKDVFDLDVKQLAQALAENLTDEVLDDVVIRLFKDCRLFYVDKKSYVDNATKIDSIFTVETLFGVYELFWLVAKYQFTPFFQNLLGRFGSLADAPKK